MAGARVVILRLAAALPLASCAPLPRMPDPPATHPASPQAIEAVLPQRAWLLDSEAEEKRSEEPTKEEPKKRQEHQHGHGHGGKK